MRVLLFLLILPLCANSQTFFAGSTPAIVTNYYLYARMGITAPTCHDIGLALGNDPAWWDFVPNSSGGCDAIFQPNGGNAGYVGGLYLVSNLSCPPNTLLLGSVCLSSSFAALPPASQQAIQSSGNVSGVAGFPTASAAAAATSLGEQLASTAGLYLTASQVTAAASAAGNCGSTSIQCLRSALAAAFGVPVSQLRDILQLLIFALVLVLILFAMRSGFRKVEPCA